MQAVPAKELQQQTEQRDAKPKSKAVFDVSSTAKAKKKPKMVAKEGKRASSEVPARPQPASVQVPRVPEAGSRRLPAKQPKASRPKSAEGAQKPSSCPVSSQPRPAQPRTGKVASKAGKEMPQKAKPLRKTAPGDAAKEVPQGWSAEESMFEPACLPEPNSFSPYIPFQPPLRDLSRPTQGSDLVPELQRKRGQNPDPWQPCMSFPLPDGDIIFSPFSEEDAEVDADAEQNAASFQRCGTSLLPDSRFYRREEPEDAEELTLDRATRELEELVQETHRALVQDGLIAPGLGKPTGLPPMAPSLDAVDRALEELQRGLLEIDNALAKPVGRYLVTENPERFERTL